MPRRYSVCSFRQVPFLRQCTPAPIHRPCAPILSARSTDKAAHRSARPAKDIASARVLPTVPWIYSLPGGVRGRVGKDGAVTLCRWEGSGTGTTVRCRIIDYYEGVFNKRHYVNATLKSRYEGRDDLSHGHGNV